MAGPSASKEELLLNGIELFNNGRFFEAHELWEEAWKRSGGAEKTLYQGLIHAAAAVIHTRRGNRDGAQSQFGKCAARLTPLAPRFMGLALEQLLADLRTYVEASRKDKNDDPLDSPPPVIRVASA
jgi:predicted metal-dependent hydrolase